jgi:hypothetical protein
MELYASLKVSEEQNNTLWRKKKKMDKNNLSYNFFFKRDNKNQVKN